MRILVVEDEPVACGRLTRHLLGRGYEVRTATTRAEALAELSGSAPDMVLLDVLLPDCRDLSLLRAMGGAPRRGLIVITSIDGRAPRLEALRAGADDYLTKPVDMDELVLKVENLSVRLGLSPSALPRYGFAGREFDPASLTLSLPGGAHRQLTQGEGRLLALFLEQPGRVLSREQLLGHLCQEPRDTADRAIDSRVYRLRRKLQAADEPELLRTVYGAGYMLDAQVQVLTAADPR
jgi:DNA-binding response OmpR family regulator